LVSDSASMMAVLVVVADVLTYLFLRMLYDRE
jgi:hypothetical protein